MRRGGEFPPLRTMEEDMGEAASGDGKGQVSATQAALDLIRALQAEYGPIMFHQSGGCCDGSSPMCYPQGEFNGGDSDVILGVNGGGPGSTCGPPMADRQPTY